MLSYGRKSGGKKYYLIGFILNLIYGGVSIVPCVVALICMNGIMWVPPTRSDKITGGLIISVAVLLWLVGNTVLCGKLRCNAKVNWILYFIFAVLGIALSYIIGFLIFVGF